MKGLTIADLLILLQQVRGETRVKAKEADIRSQFLQSASDEIFTDHDWTFNKRVDTIEIDAEGLYEVPADFSLLNDFNGIGAVYTYLREDFEVVMDNSGNISLKGPTDASLILNYYIKCPDLIPGVKKLYFPQPMLVAERAYVRLKTAYFPDEESDKELLRSKKALRELYAKSVPKQNFTHKALR